MRSPLFAGLCIVGLAACGSSVGPAAGGGTPAAVVSIQEYAFSPANVTVKAGTAVRWENDGTVAHTVTSDAGGFGSGQLAAATNSGGAYGGGTAGASFQASFPNTGTFAYHCANHAQMIATVTVVP